MKVQVAKIDSQASGFLNNTQFGIGDAAMVMEVLRNQLYNDPLFSSVREYLCNARDANREAGNSLPIEVTLPTYTNLFLTISDRGPGISPDRMANVFCQFGMSTKRHTNDLTGGFGLGGKSGFAYSDTFNIVSVVDGTRRTYSSYIDETRLGAMTLLKEEATDMPNGTSIVLPIKREDLDRTRVIIKAATYFWSIRPKFFEEKYDSLGNLVRTDCSIGYNEKEQILYQGDDWYCVKANLANSLARSSSSKLYVLIDEIPYDIDLGKFDYSLQSKIGALISNNFRIKFNNGELSLAASRDSITYDPKTIKAITAKYDIIANDISLKINEAVSQNTSYLDALIHLLEIKTSISSIKIDAKLSWNGRELYGHDASSYQFWGFGTADFYNLYSYTRSATTTSLSLYNFLKICKDSPNQIFILDEEKMSLAAYAKKLCAKYNIGNVYLVRINDDKIESIQDKTLQEQSKNKLKLIREFVKNKISEVSFDKEIKTRASYNRKTLSDKQNILAYNFNQLLLDSSNSKLEEVSLNSKSAYVFYDYEMKGFIGDKFKFATNKTKIPRSITELHYPSLCKNLNIDKIYAVTQSKLDKVSTGSWLPLENVIENEKQALLAKHDLQSWQTFVFDLRLIKSMGNHYNANDIASYIFKYLKCTYEPSNGYLTKENLKLISDVFSSLGDNHIFSKIVSRYKEVCLLESDISKFEQLFKDEVVKLDNSLNDYLDSYKAKAQASYEQFALANLINSNSLFFSLYQFAKENISLFRNLSNPSSFISPSYDYPTKLLNKFYYQIPINTLDFLRYIK